MHPIAARASARLLLDPIETRARNLGARALPLRGWYVRLGRQSASNLRAGLCDGAERAFAGVDVTALARPKFNNTIIEGIQIVVSLATDSPLSQVVIGDRWGGRPAGGFYAPSR